MKTGRNKIRILSKLSGWAQICLLLLEEGRGEGEWSGLAKIYIVVFRHTEIFFRLTRFVLR